MTIDTIDRYCIVNGVKWKQRITGNLLQTIHHMKKQTQSGAIISLYTKLKEVASLILFLLISMQSAKALSIMSSSSTLKRATTAAPRIELFFSSTEELRKRITLLKSKGVTSFNLVNKSNRDDILQSVQIIQQEFQDDNDDPAVSVCAHYSMKYNKSRKKDGAFLQLKDYVEHMNELNNPQNNEILFITGSGPKGKLCSLTALQRLQQESISISPSVAVAFNPFFPNPQDYDEEVRRLTQKLETGIVSKVYLQFGADLEKLQSALQMLTTLQSTTTTKQFEICGSIFLPTKQLIAQQKFRPWNGVFLNDEFLSSEDGARRIVLQMMRLYKEYSAEILIEAPGVRSEKDWSIVESLLKERDELMSKEGVDKKSEEKGGKVGRDDESNVTATTFKLRKTSPTSELLPSSILSAEILNKPAIVLFHSHDVRLHDNVALQTASHHQHIIPVFLWSKKEQGPWGVRGCLEVVLKDALCNLDKKLEQFDLKLVCREGDDSSSMLRQICEECNVGAVYWNKEHTTESRVREEKYRAMLEEISVESIECQSSLLYDPTSPSLAAGFHGGHWGTLMPFKKTCEKQLGMPRRPIPRSDTFFMLEQMSGPMEWPESKDIDELSLAVINGKEQWDKPILDRFPMSEEAAVANMNTFFQSGFAKYERDRSRADIDWSTSKLSAHLRIGSLSPNELYYKIEDSNLDYNDRKTFSRRLIWRDLAYFHLHSFPNMRDTSIRLHYEQTEWVSGEEGERRFDAWKTGTTGCKLSLLVFSFNNCMISTYASTQCIQIH